MDHDIIALRAEVYAHSAKISELDCELRAAREQVRLLAEVVERLRALKS